MSDQIIRRASRIVDSKAAMPWLVAAGVYLLLITLGHRLLADPDCLARLLP